jgi:WD40 repeat protein
VRIWNGLTGDPIKTLESHSESVSCVAWSPDDRKIACSFREKKIIIWDALSGMNSFQPVNTVNALAWSPDGSEIVSNYGNQIQVIRTLRS